MSPCKIKNKLLTSHIHWSKHSHSEWEDWRQINEECDQRKLKSSRENIKACSSMHSLWGIWFDMYAKVLGKSHLQGVADSSQHAHILSLGPSLLPDCHFPWQKSHASDMSNYIGSPFPLWLYPHDFTHHLFRVHPPGILALKHHAYFSMASFEICVEASIFL
jgi:hypothetical protein